MLVLEMNHVALQHCLESIECSELGFRFGRVNGPNWVIQGVMDLIGLFKAL